MWYMTQNISILPPSVTFPISRRPARKGEDAFRLVSLHDGANATRRHSASILDFASRHGTPGTGISEHTQYGEYVEDRDAEPIEPTGVAIFQDLEVGFATG
jgi:hypothetical protein